MWLTRAGGRTCTTDDGKSTEEVPRVDNPPYEIDEPSCDDGRRDPHWLCENVAAEPSLPFEQETVPTRIFENEGLDLETAAGDAQFYAALVTDADDLDRLDGPPEMISEADFATETVLLVQTGYGSSTIVPHLKRVESTADGIHAVGCYSRPCIGTGDVAVRTVAARFEHPDALESVTVSLTIDPETRVTFSPDNGVVTLEDGEAIEAEPDFPRVDEPPYEVTEPSCAPDASRDPLWMCENMPAEPSLSFEQDAISGPILRDKGIDTHPEIGTSQYYAALLTGEEDLERVDREFGGSAVDLITATDFSSAAVLVVQTGWGSSSVRPHLKRIEATDDGIHAFGCYTSPCAQTDDVTVRTVVARFDRPETLESGAVSLTTDPETRVNVRAGDGVVTVEDGEVV